jgi:hypothetical protein
MKEPRKSENVILKFMIQLPHDDQNLLNSCEIQAYEDFGTHLARMKLLSTNVISENTIALELCITNYDFESQANRGYILHFIER